MITANSDSSDRSVTARNTHLSLPKSASDLRRLLNSDRSDRNSHVPAPCARKTLNARNPLIGHCCHCKPHATTTGNSP
jgi:hypothetical protein